MRFHVTFTTVRAVAGEVAEEFIRECPHVVRGTFTGLGG
jgi:hypothetical protein